MVTNKQKRETNSAGDLAWSAIQAIQEAQRFTPDMPAIRMPQVNEGGRGSGRWGGGIGSWDGVLKGAAVGRAAREGVTGGDFFRQKSRRVGK